VGKKFGGLKLNIYFCSRNVRINDNKEQYDTYTEQLLVVALSRLTSREAHSRVYIRKNIQKGSSRLR
jgi:hypothetical protein